MNVKTGPETKKNGFVRVKKSDSRGVRKKNDRAYESKARICPGCGRSGLGPKRKTKKHRTSGIRAEKYQHSGKKE